MINPDLVWGTTTTFDTKAEAEAHGERTAANRLWVLLGVEGSVRAGFSPVWTYADNAETPR